MKRLIAISLLIPLLLGCVRNDIPYPRVVPNIVSMTVEGGTVSINPSECIVRITLEETVDLRNVKIIDCTIDKENVRLSENLVGIHDLSEEWQVTLSTWQDYIWTISAERPIERYFTVDGQVGSPVIDIVNKRAVAYVSKITPLDNVKVTSLKLGPRNVTTYSPNPESIRKFLDTDGNPTYVEVSVSSFGDTEDWKLFVEQSDVSINVKSVNVWTKEAYITASGISGQDNGFKYRMKGAGDNWSVVPQASITSNGGEFTAHISGLEPATSYEYYAYTGEDSTDVAEFVTNEDRQFPNSSFDVFSIVTGKDYYKWFDPSSPDPECREKWWACGNGEGPDGVNGTASLGIVLTYPDTEDKVDGIASVRCESKNFAGILACGNLFTGTFAKVIGTTGGSVYYGRPWTTRPHALRLWMKYQSGRIDLVKNLPVGEKVEIGDNDRCEIAVSVGNWDYRKMGGVPDSPVYVNTTDGIYYTSESEGVIAFGHLVMNESTDGWQQIEIPLEYKDLTLTPTHIIVTCASSYLGDYLTGSSSSKLWVDNLELLY
ncbi:MAG: PCMD domain-containing protein [Candidatus Cryptobacteroides sp.]